METYVDRWKRQKAEKEKLTQKKRKNSQKKAGADSAEKGDVEDGQTTGSEGQAAEKES